MLDRQQYAICFKFPPRIAFNPQPALGQIPFEIPCTSAAVKTYPVLNGIRHTYRQVDLCKRIFDLQEADPPDRLADRNDEREAHELNPVPGAWPASSRLEFDRALASEKLDSRAGPNLAQARISLTTLAGYCPISRSSSPCTLNTSPSGSSPSRCSIVAWKSWTLTRSSTAL